MTVLHEMTNLFLSATVNSLGAELIEFTGADGVGYLWGGDPKIWGRRAPILFPIVGKLKSGVFRHRGHTYHLSQHGFARDLDFDLVSASPTDCAFELVSSEMTRSQYPFDFTLRVTYRLRQNTLEIGFAVHNDGQEVMPFSLGAHPAFSLNWPQTDRREDYYLEFERDESAGVYHLDENQLLSADVEPFSLPHRTLFWRSDLFARDALIFLNNRSKHIKLASRKEPRWVDVRFSQFSDLGIWAKPGAPFVCVEPWLGYVDPATVDGVLINKPGMVHLAPSARFDCGYQIVINAEATG